MRGFTKEILDILRILENYPLDSFSDHARKLGISTQTMIRKVEYLKDADKIREVHSTLNPEKMGFERYVVIFKTTTVEQISFLELSCDIHPYTNSRNRLFGHMYGLYTVFDGLYTVFDIPKGTKKYLESFLEFMLGREFCSHYKIYKSAGKRAYYPQPFHNNVTDMAEFDIEEYFSKNVNWKPKIKVNESSEFSINKFHPIHLLILRDITINMRTPMSQLSQKYKEYLTLPKEEENFDGLPEGFRPHIEEFFAEDRTENAIYIDFKKKYHFIIDNFIEDYWWGVNRKYFEMFIRFSYIISNIKEEEKSRLFRLLSEFRPPFSIYMEDLGQDLFYQIRMAYWMRSNYENLSFYMSDSFGYNAMKYRFYVHNYNIKDQKWREDEEWMFKGAVKGIQESIAKKQFRKVSSEEEK
jgi:hypothetical protein